MNKLRSRKFMTALSLLTMAGLSAVAGYGQTTAAPATTTTPAATTDQQPMVLDKFEVTGSYIPAAADESKALPVRIIDAAAIEQTGISTSVLDVLRKTVPQIQGAGNIGQENANVAGNSTNGGSKVELRNTDTLVLIDGKRVASSPVAASGGFEFVDLNLIPLSAVERIEVLTDGASAIYGTDAVSGVINIILKKDFTGVEIDTHYAVSKNDTGGYYKERGVSAVAGASDKNTHIMVAAEWTKSDPLYERDFNYTNPSYGTSSYPGIVNDSAGNFYQLKPGLNAPPNTTPTTFANLVAQGVYVPIASSQVPLGFNLAEKPTFVSGNDKKIADFSVSHDIGSKLELKGDFLYSDTDTGYILNPQPVSASIASLVGDAGVPITDTSGLTIRNRFVAGPNRVYDNQTTFYRGTADLIGTINEYFNFDLYVNYNDSKQMAYGGNQILNSALLAGLAAGQINLFAINQDPTQLAAANIFGTSIGAYESKLISYDAIFHGKILDIWSGPIEYAAGAEYRKQTLSATADYNSLINEATGTSAWNNGVTINPFDQQENIKSYFAELKVPITSPQNAIPGLYLLSLDGAVRHEEYSTGDSVSVPKVSIRYLPVNDQLAFRSTYSKSFTAPSLYDLYGPSNSGFTASPGGLNAYNSAGQPTGAKFANLQGFEASGSNSALQPATAKSWTVGVIISPKALKGLEFTVDYYNIKQENVISNPASDLDMMQSVEALGPASPFAQYVTLNNFANRGGAHVTAPGQVSTNLVNIYVLESLVNIGSENQDGMDFELKYTFPWEKYGRFTLQSNWAYLRSFVIKQGPTDPGTDYAGYNDDGTLPHLRSYSSVDWTYKGFGATLAYTHIPKVDDYEGGFASPYNTFDLQGRFDLGELVDSRLTGLSVNLGVNNLTNQKPPVDSNVFSDAPTDLSAYSPFGRLLYVDLKYKF
jgi:iron complex outermembrane receptor protein